MDMDPEDLLNKAFDGSPPTCDKCGGQPFDSKYKEAGNEIVRATLAASVIMAAGAASFKITGTLSAAEKVLKKAGKDDLAKHAQELNTINNLGDYYEENFAADIAWEEQGGQMLCYKCKS